MKCMYYVTYKSHLLAMFCSLLGTLLYHSQISLVKMKIVKKNLALGVQWLFLRSHIVEWSSFVDVNLFEAITGSSTYLS